MKIALFRSPGSYPTDLVMESAGLDGYFRVSEIIEVEFTKLSDDVIAAGMGVALLIAITFHAGWPRGLQNCRRRLIG